MHCSECGKEFRKKAYNSEFCGGACRRVFNNRRAVRGAILYDLTMLDIKGKHENVRARIEALITEWLSADAKAGRARTWQHPNGVLSATHYLTAIVS